jgi:hypothetical protein
VGILSWMWVAPGVISGIYFGIEFITPNKKKYLIITYLILGVIFELFLFLDTMNSTSYVYPANPGENLIDAQLVLRSPAGILSVIFILTAVIILGFGFLIKGINTTGIIRKKFLYLSAGFLIWALTAAFEGLTAPGIFLFICRFIMISSFVFLYFGVKEEAIKPKQLIPDKGISREMSEISLTKILNMSRPEKITEQEVTYYREQKICLVCKGKISGLNFVCPNCTALYCIKCFEVLSNAENACWVCDNIIDNSMPKKEYSKKDTKEEIELRKDIIEK